MSMYPYETSVIIDGEPVSYPGLRNGKFTSGDPNDPAHKPSFIPAESINLIIDNLSKVIEFCGLSPNNTSINQLKEAFQSKFLQTETLTPSMILDKLKMVDGAGSGLDADMLDGFNSSSFVKTSDYTAVDVLTKIKTVDGAGSGLDADMLGGNTPDEFAPMPCRSNIIQIPIPPVGFSVTDISPVQFPERTPHDGIYDRTYVRTYDRIGTFRLHYERSSAERPHILPTLPEGGVWAYMLFCGFGHERWVEFGNIDVGVKSGGSRVFLNVTQTIHEVAGFTWRIA